MTTLSIGGTSRVSKEQALPSDQDLEKIISDSIEVEAKLLTEYRKELSRFDKEKQYLAAAMNGYRIQISAYGNMLFSPSINPSAIQKATAELRTSNLEIQRMIDEIQTRLDTLDQDQTRQEEQQDLIQTPLKTLQAKPNIVQKERRLSAILAEKGQIIDKLHQNLTERQEKLLTLKKDFSDLLVKFETSIERQKKINLFERSKGILTIDVVPLLSVEAGHFTDFFRHLAGPAFWMMELKTLWKEAGLVLISLIALFGAGLVMIRKISRAVKKARTHPFLSRLGPWHDLALQMADQSFLLAGIAVLTYLYAGIDVLYRLSPTLYFFSRLTLAGLLVQWARHAAGNWPGGLPVLEGKKDSVKRLFTVIQYICWIHILLDFVPGDLAGFSFIVRVAFSVGFLIWTVRVFRRPDSIHGTEKEQLPGPEKEFKRRVLRGFCYLVGGGALFLDITGYRYMALHWLTAWGVSLAVLLWWFIFFRLLSEWNQYYREKNSSEQDELLHNDYPIQWLMIRFGQLVCAVSFILLQILVWGGKQTVLVKLYTGLGHEVAVGNMRFSLLGILYALLILVATHAVSRLCKWFLQARLLNQSGMDVGLMESITTLVVYVIWIFGILISLHAFGLNATSLTVAFGAISIGLGFGLQNIFNNFVSGIILLFERPIQVGDDVEINGTWAEVKKINFRSTVVQTYDNASLIIPNSEFVSSQVTNWSFKDKRIRRKIHVGVAYGSDTELVRDTLLEIASKTPKVLKIPKPDVLFSDFGDSALVFTLRVWTDIMNMLRVETAIRFEIDRLFKEHGIEIAFPQRDIHIRSTVADTGSKPEGSMADETVTADEQKDKS